MISPQQAAETLLLRRKARNDFRAWCQLLGFEPAKHHDLVIQILERVIAGTVKKVMLLMPPGSAKSTYTSKAFPAHYLCRKPTNCILSCSYSKDLVIGFGRTARNYVQQYQNVLGYTLSTDTKAADEWQTSNGGRYFCAGVNAGIAGHRADLGLIDDPIGSEEDADSKSFRTKLASWYVNDFIPRLKPNAAQVLIANRRHEEDLCGMILNKTKDHPNGLMGDSDEWVVIRIPYFADELNDPLRRKIGEPLWPEYFNDTFAKTVAKMPARTKAGLYQQKPSPEEGNYFKKTWLKGYESQDLPPLSELRIYTASDHAISKADTANKTCFLSAGVDCNDEIWILPYIFWERADSAEQIDAMIQVARMYKPLTWRAEQGHISKSLGPFLRKRMRETKCYFNIIEYNPAKDKQSRARCIQGRMSQGLVHWPKFAPWYTDAEHDLLMFDAGKEDDLIDALAHLGNQIDSMTAPSESHEEQELFNQEQPSITFAWLKQSRRAQEIKREALLND